MLLCSPCALMIGDLQPTASGPALWKWGLEHLVIFQLHFLHGPISVFSCLSRFVSLSNEGA